MTTFQDTIDWTRLVVDVRALAAMFPDVTYDRLGLATCEYPPDYNNVFGCIIGAGLIKQGFDVVTVARDRDDGFDNDAAIDPPHDNYQDTRNDWLSLVQQYQDSGDAWGAAVKRADDQAMVDGTETAP